MIGCRSEGLCWEGPHTQCQCDPPFPCQKMAFGKVTGGFGEREEGSRAVQQQQQHPKRFPILVAASLCQQSHPRREQLLQQHPGSHPDPSQSHPPPLTHHRLPAPASSHPPNPFSPPSSFLLPVWMLSIHSELLPVSLLLRRSAEAPAPLCCIIINFFSCFFSLPQLHEPRFQRFSCPRNPCPLG